MTELDIDKLVEQTNDDEIKCMLLNLYTYEDMEDYTYYTCYTKEDFKGLQSDGWVLDITPGTYNGAMDKMDYVSELTLFNIYGALLEESKQDSFQEMLEDMYEEPNASEARQVRLLTEAYDVFTIGNHLFMDYL